MPGMWFTNPPTPLINGIAHRGNEPSAMKSSSRQWLASARTIAVAESKFAILGFSGRSLAAG